jgi:protein arginine kinase
MTVYHSAPEEDIVLSSRVRLARNYRDIPFAPIMDRNCADETIRRAQDAINASGDISAFRIIKMADLTKDQRIQLVERHLISFDLLNFSERSAALISGGETLSIMVNEEDHLRIQGLLPGMQLERVADLAYGADDRLSAKYEYAFDSQLGFLTTCPTNTGTGMRASVMMHLPALSISKRIGNVVQSVGKLGLTVRGIYGEGSEAQGNLYQLSNQVTLGRSEDDIVKMLIGVAAQTAANERAVRKKLLSQDRLALEDRLLRSLSITRSARLMDSTELMKRYSDLRLAASLGIIKLRLIELDRLMMDMQPASLNVSSGKDLNDREQKEYRAEALRKRISEMMGSQ